MKTYLTISIIFLLSFCQMKIYAQDQGWGTGRKLTPKDSAKLERILKRYDLNAKEHEALAMAVSGEQLSTKERRYANRAMWKMDKMRAKSHKVFQKRHYKIQSKKSRAQMKYLEQSRKAHGYNARKPWWKKIFPGNNQKKRK
jgi:hypothetical protein